MYNTKRHLKDLKNPNFKTKEYTPHLLHMEGFTRPIQMGGIRYKVVNFVPVCPLERKISILEYFDVLF